MTDTHTTYEQEADHLERVLRLSIQLRNLTADIRRTMDESDSMARHLMDGMRTG